MVFRTGSSRYRKTYVCALRGVVALSAVTEEEFVEKVSAMAFAPPLGGSFCSAKDGKEIEPEIIRCFFRLLVREGSEKLTRHRMSTRMKELAGDEEGLNWKNFEGALQ
uniref:Uncharacterized protein n=1 Tax=Corethron hystrix TaxID=216773 RepID=A0A7S1BTJ5_9STRA|mmetsp:Transcript_39410/g.92049  ORF Transcript_39410/g.92049 Transcript_39410/m.92049 type:complete len:108 (+) Transcript_39410:535-858(+)